MWTVLVLLVYCVLGSYARESLCPENICDLVNDCSHSPQSHKDCPPMTSYVENMWHCNCCPACVKYKYVGEACSLTDETLTGHPGTGQGFIESSNCTAGLECTEENGNYSCTQVDDDFRPCWNHYKDYEENHDEKYWMWEPDCDSNGYYKPKQCKGTEFEGRCHCVDKDGEIIFGDRWIRDDADDMTCECSRKYSQMEKDGVIDITIVCTSEGNYRNLQCQNGFCFCENSKGTNASGTVVPEDMRDTLTCYSESKHKDNYLEGCALELHRQKSLEKLFIERGTILLSATSPSCNPDQTFTAVQCTDTFCFCIRRDNSFGSANCDDPSLPQCINMNCFCERDREDMEATGSRFPYKCRTDNGNYYKQQNPLDDVYFCVDETGYQDSDIYSEEDACCLPCTNECTRETSCTATPPIFTRFMKQ